MVNYQKEKVVIIGLGLTGFSCINFFLNRNVIPVVVDTQISPQYLKKIPRYVKCCLGKLDEKLILNATLIVISPGVSLSHPILLEAANLGIEIIGDIELFMREASKPIIAITGSSGKSTVTQLLTQMASYFGLVVGVGGNIGVPALMLLDKFCHLYILELSSFQLETTYTLRATAATILNISCDHMNRYSFGLPEYRSAKLKIYQNAKFCLINASDSLTYPLNRSCNSNYISFGDKFGDYHLGYHGGRLCLMIDYTPLLYCSEIKITGYHNYMNALAAIALADIIMIPHKYSLLALRRFSGLSHCLELVHKNNGIRWINDSKATNVNSTIAAIKSLLISYDQGILHLLLGGDSKCANFLPLVSWMQKEKVKVYCFGKDAEILAKYRSNDAIITKNMEQAICIINNYVRKNDTVLLSPACSSLDQFRNFKVRGYIFSRLAKKFG